MTLPCLSRDTLACLVCEAIFAMHDVVPQGLASSMRFRDEVLAALESLAAHGARATLTKINHREETS